MKTVKLFLSSKVGANEKITFIENDKVVSDDNKVAETFKLYFETIVENLDINRKKISDESVTDITRKFENHPQV